MQKIKIIDTNAGNILEYGVCGYKNIKRSGYPEKVEWLKDRFQEGLKNVKEICETAGKIYGIKPKIIDLKNYKEAQNSPCAFGSFCIIYNGKVIAYHPISNTRFINIMNQ